MIDNPVDMNRPACVLTPGKDEDPFFIDERMFRSDIRADTSDGSIPDGVPLELSMRVSRADGDGSPVEGAQVDLWQCNAHGLYSDVEVYRTVGRKYLRGCQRTNPSGEVRFITIFPGWYWNRTVHIHFKIRVAQPESEIYEFTSQLFFDQSVIEEVHRTYRPYSMRGQPDVSNDQDEVFKTEGSKLTVPLARNTNDGYRGAISVALAGLPSGTD